MKVIIDNIENEFKKADFETLARYNQLVLEGNDIGDEYKADKYLMEQCFVEGDERILDLDNNADLLLQIQTHEDYQPIDEYPVTIEQNKDIFKITVVTPDKTYVGNFSKLKSFEDLCSYSRIAVKSALDGDKILVRSCFIDGDIELKHYTQNPFLFWSYRHCLHYLLGLYKDEVKKK